MYASCRQACPEGRGSKADVFFACSITVSYACAGGNTRWTNDCDKLHAGGDCVPRSRCQRLDRRLTAPWRLCRRAGSCSQRINGETDPGRRHRVRHARHRHLVQLWKDVPGIQTVALSPATASRPLGTRLLKAHDDNSLTLMNTARHEPSGNPPSRKTTTPPEVTFPRDTCH
jgi:hypothetical protein